MTRRWLAASLLVSCWLAVAAASTGCEGDDGARPLAEATPGATAYTYTDATEPGGYAVGTMTMALVDNSRPTAANGDFAGSAERAITVHSWYPAGVAGADAPLDASGAPYPLLVWAHGFSSLPTLTSAFLSHMASHGYVVAAPEFPLTRLSAPGGPNFVDILNQSGDISFVIDEMLAMSADASHRLAGAVDPERIGLAGHSGGGYTTNLALYGPDADERIDAALSLSGDRCVVDAGEAHESDAAVMFMTGSEDLFVSSEASRVAYDAASAPRYFVNVLGGNHIRFTGVDLEDATQAERVRSDVGEQLENAPALDELLPRLEETCDLEPRAAGHPTITLTRQQELLRAFATPFFAAYLEGDAAARDFLHTGIGEATEGATEYDFEAE